MLSQTECQEIVDISTKVINTYSKNWNKCTVFTGYCHKSYGGFSLTYQDAESKQLSYLGELYSNITDKEMYSFEGYSHINEMLKKYYEYCQNDPNLHWNQGTLTIYPNGEYESSFIWNNYTHLDSLVQTIEGWFALITDEAHYRVKERCDMLSIDWDFNTEVVISFTNGKSNPVLFITENNPLMTFSLFLEQMYYYIDIDYAEAFEVCAKERQEYNETELRNIDNENYLLMNEGELKGRYPRWNVMRFTVNPKSEPIFEWREDLA